VCPDGGFKWEKKGARRAASWRRNGGGWPTASTRHGGGGGPGRGRHRSATSAQGRQAWVADGTGARHMETGEKGGVRYGCLRAGYYGPGPARINSDIL
jgi:hypothetical protein